jgi:polysaccharide deacetylase family protein (PEP-CTERM system associated)
MKNALTFDIEDYFMVSGFSDHVDKSEWMTLPSRVEANTDKVLAFLADSRSTATFFTLGWVARRFPALIRRIADAGHEVGCHSLEHRKIFEMSPEEFREDTRSAKQALEDAGGQPVKGYRAPSFSITKDSLWAFEVLVEAGFTYDSSIFPVKHPSYGMPKAPRTPFVIETPAGGLVEYPMMTLEYGGARSPLGGGAYFRLLPYWFTSWALRYVNSVERRPTCIYLHPWELDSEQPRVNARASSRLRHYLGLRGAEKKLKRLLRDFDFQSLGSLIRETEDAEAVPSRALSSLYAAAPIEQAVHPCGGVLPG